MKVICDYNTHIRQIKFVQGTVISSEYTINEIHNVTRQHIKTIQEYLHNAHIILNQHTTTIKSYDTVLNSR